MCVRSYDSQNLPPTITHTVLPDENLRTISDSYGYDYDQILSLNPYATRSPRAGAQITLVVPDSSTQLGINLTTSGSISTGGILTGDTDDLTRRPTTECVSDGYTFFAGEELSYLWRQPLRDDTHRMIYDYANGWTIDLNTGAPDASLHSAGQTILQRGLRDGWITENPDGSYDVSLTLYFRPQSRFYLGLLISGTTFIGLISWLLWDWRRPRHKSLDFHR